jgi:hypothetical protein
MGKFLCILTESNIHPFFENTIFQWSRTASRDKKTAGKIFPAE